MLIDSEIVEQSQERVIADYADAYEKYKEARRTGGPCEVCGWRDGDGVKACFYSPDLGAVTHQNTEAGAMLSMTEEQRSLFRLRQKLLYIDADLREKSIRWVAHQRGEPLDSEFMVDYRKQQETPPLADEPLYRDWVRGEWWVPAKDIPEHLRGPVRQSKYGIKTSYMVHVYEPHPDCGGIQVFVGPYHFMCSKCGAEVRLWEHGVDYDIG